MIQAIYAGSFDPLTLGHLDIIKRGANLVDKLYIGVLLNETKNSYMFTVDERINHIKKVTKNIKNIEIITFNGLLLNFVLENNINFILKGVRNTTDFDLEMNMSMAIKMIDENVETLFIPTDKKYMCVSSSIVKQALKYNGDITNFVPKEIKKDIETKYNGGIKYGQI